MTLKRSGIMHAILLIPTHRRFINILQEHIKTKGPIILTAEDLLRLKEFSQGHVTMNEQHRRIYSLALRAINRQPEDIPLNSETTLVDLRVMNQIEKSFARAERRHLRVTLENRLIVPLLRKTLRRLEK